MADDTTLNAGSGGDVIATDDDGSRKHQYVKIEFGADNVFTKVDASNPLPVEIGDGTNQLVFDTDDGIIAASQVLPPVLGLHYGWDGTQWQRVKVGAVSQALFVESKDTEVDDDIIAASQTKPAGIALGYAFDGTQWERLKTDAAGSLNVAIVSGGEGPDDLISTNNSTTTPLGVSGTFVGTGDDCQGFSAVTIQLFSDVASATDGMTFEFSTDNTNWDDSYAFTLAAGEARRFQFPVTARYFRVNFTNGGTGQATFRVQTILHRQNVLTSVHRIVDSVDPDRSAQLVKAVIAAQAAGSGDFVPVQATAAGNFKASVEEYDAALTESDDGVVPVGSAWEPKIGLNYGYDGTNWVRPQGAESEDGTIVGGLSRFVVANLSYGFNGANWVRWINSVTENDAITAGGSRPVAVGLNYGWDGANWERVKTDAGGNLSVADSRGQTDDGSIVGGAFQNAGISFPYFWSGSAWVRVAAQALDDDSITSGSAYPLQIGLNYGYDGADWQRLLTDSGGALQVLSTAKGATASDSPIVSNPLTVGGRASTAVPTAVSADGDVVNGWFDRRGALKNVIVDDAGVSAMDGVNNALQVNVVAGGAGGGSVDGVDAHDAPITGDPVLVGGRASNTAPSDVSVNDDAVRAWMSRAGSLVVAGYDGAAPQHIAVDTSGNSKVVGAVAGGASAAAVNPIISGGVDEAGNAQAALIRTEDDSISAGSPQLTVVGLNYGFDGVDWGRVAIDSTSRRLQVEASPLYSDTDDGTVASGAAGQRLISLGYIFDGTNWIRPRAEADDNAIPYANVHQSVVGLMYGDDGTDWQRLSVDTSGRLISNGPLSHDSPYTGINPVTVGAYASDAEPTAVSADGDVVRLWADKLGRLVTVGGHPAPEAPVVVQSAASGDVSVISAPGASLSLYIKRVVINNGGSAVNAVQLQENGSAVNRGGGDLAANGGGMVLDYGDRGWKLTANTALEVNIGTAGDIWVSVLEYYIAA